MIFQSLELLFQITCITMVFLCMTAFFGDLFKNESTSKVDFRTFHEEEKDIYPSISLCFGGPQIWNAKKLKEMYGVENYGNYAEFLRGNLWNEKMLLIDYDTVTLSLEDYIAGWMLWMDSGFKDPTFVWYNESDPIIESKLGELDTTPITESYISIGLRSADVKCFTFDLSSIEMLTEKKIIKKLEILMKNQNESVTTMYAAHYPKQLIAGHFSFDIGLKKSFFGQKTFFINMIEVIRRRNTHKEPCYDETNNHDLYVLSNLIRPAKCKPPYLKYESEFDNLEICNDSISMKQTDLDAKYLDSLAFRKRFDKPCDELETVVFNTKEYSHRKDGLENSSWILEISFANEIYKEIRQIQSYNVKSCWSDVSAIIGFVCGVSIWQIPNGLKTMIDLMKHRILSKD